MRDPRKARGAVGGAPGGGSEQTEPGPYLTIRQCAAEVSTSTWTIWKLCRLGVIPSIRVGTKPGSGHYRITQADWEKWKAAVAVAVRPLWSVLVDSGGDGTPLIDRVLGRKGR